MADPSSSARSCGEGERPDDVCAFRLTVKTIATASGSARAGAPSRKTYSRKGHRGDRGRPIEIACDVAGGSTDSADIAPPDLRWSLSATLA